MSSQNNLSELNTVLFETLRGVKDGSIKASDAKVINEISGTIINNAKVQLEAVKTIRGGKGGEMFGVQGVAIGPGESEDLFDIKMKFSKESGYSNIAEAINGFGGTWKFEEAFKEWKLTHGN